MTKQLWLPTKAQHYVKKIAQILGIQTKCATNTHPQTIGKLERTHATLNTNLKMASWEYRRQLHKYLELAVLNYNTSYYSTLGCESTRIFHGRIPYDILDLKLGLITNPEISPTTDFAEEFPWRTQTLIDEEEYHSIILKM